MSVPQDLLKKLGADEYLGPPRLEDDLIAELLREETRAVFPRPEKIKQTPEEAIKLYDKCYQLAFWSSKNYKVFIGKFGLEEEDFNQIVLHSLWIAALTYDPLYKTAFSTWAHIIVRQHVGREITRNYIRPGRIGEVVVLQSDDGDIVLLNDIQDYKELPIVEKLIAHEILENLHKVNNQRDAEILVERLLWDMTLEECSINRQLTRERIRQLEKRGLQKLKAMYHSGSAKLIS